MSDQEHSSSVAGSDAHEGVRPEELIAKLEGAAEGSRELDFEFHISQVEDAIWPAMDRRGRIINPHSRMSDYLATYRDVISADDQDFDFPRYTTSIDAILALIERELSGCVWRVGFDPDYGTMLASIVGEAPICASGLARHNDPKLALCIAFLKARSADQPRAPQEDRPGRVMNPDPALARKEP